MVQVVVDLPASTTLECSSSNSNYLYLVEVVVVVDGFSQLLVVLVLDVQLAQSLVHRGHVLLKIHTHMYIGTVSMVTKTLS